jgi:hypothetical protein
MILLLAEERTVHGNGMWENTRNLLLEQATIRGSPTVLHEAGEAAYGTTPSMSVLQRTGLCASIFKRVWRVTIGRIAVRPVLERVFSGLESRLQAALPAG